MGPLTGAVNFLLLYLALSLAAAVCWYLGLARTTLVLLAITLALFVLRTVAVWSYEIGRRRDRRRE